MRAWKDAGLQPVGHLVWNKSYASKTGFLAAHHECAYLLTNGHPKPPLSPIAVVLAWKYTGNRYRPTQKPVMAIEPLVKTFSRPGDLILDPFAGSGTTAVASRLNGRDYLGLPPPAVLFAPGSTHQKKRPENRDSLAFCLYQTVLAGDPTGRRSAQCRTYCATGAAAATGATGAAGGAIGATGA